jgi:hypothetical protein
MLKEKQMQEIQDMTLRCYSIIELVSYYANQGKQT